MDESLRPLLRLKNVEYPHHERACRIYTHWMRGIQEEDVAAFFHIKTEDVQTDILHIQELLPDETATRHTEDRVEILTTIAEGEKQRWELSESLSLSAEDCLKSGIDPAEILKKYREACGIKSPGLASSSDRIQNADRICFDSSAGGTALDEGTWIEPSHGREEPELPTIGSMTNTQAKGEIAQNARLETVAKGSTLKGTHGRRITIRVDDATMQSLLREAKENNSDVSLIVRQALQAHLQNGKILQCQEESSKSIISPEEIAKHSVKYLSWSGDVRQEARRLFLETLGAVTAAIRGHPRTPGLREIHDGLLVLGKHLKFGLGGRQDTNAIAFRQFQVPTLPEEERGEIF